MIIICVDMIMNVYRHVINYKLLDSIALFTMNHVRLVVHHAP